MTMIFVSIGNHDGNAMAFCIPYDMSEYMSPEILVQCRSSVFGGKNHMYPNVCPTHCPK